MSWNTTPRAFSSSKVIRRESGGTIGHFVVVEGDYEAHAIECAGGETLIGVIKSHTAEGLLLVDIGGTEHNIRHEQITADTMLPTSLMPVGLAGVFLAALLNFVIGSKFGWRYMFGIGGLPALLLAWVRHGVTEPACWKQKEGVVRAWRIWQPLASLFSSALRRRTILNSLFMLASICGLWAGTVYVPAAVTVLAEAAGRAGPLAAQLASRATMLVSFATILGCLAMPWLAEKLGRRGALGFFFALMAAFIALTFGKVFYLGASALAWFFVCLFFLGFGGANFAVYTLWLPEQYPTECRASAFAFSTSFARFAGAAITFLVGAGVQHFQSLGIPVALTSIAFAIGLLLIPFGVETRGQTLPA